MSNQSQCSTSCFSRASYTEPQEENIQTPESWAELLKQNRDLQEKCSHLEFENGRLRRTLRCVDCNSRIGTAALADSYNSLDTDSAIENPTESFSCFPVNSNLSAPSENSSYTPIDTLQFPDPMLEAVSMFEGSIVLPIVLDAVRSYNPANVLPLPEESANPQSSLLGQYTGVEGLRMPYQRYNGNAQSDWLPWSDMNAIFDGDACQSPSNSETNRKDATEYRAVMTYSGSGTGPVESVNEKDFGQYDRNEVSLPSQNKTGIEEIDLQDNISARHMSHLEAQHNNLDMEGGSPGHTGVLSNPLLPVDIIPYTVDMMMGFNTRPPKPGLDRYILALRLLIKRALNITQIPLGKLESLMADGIMWIVQEAWPEAEWFWKFTDSFNGFLQSEIWRNFPCQTSYKKLHAAYRPTTLQLRVPHSPIIDWLPWPDLRDRVIMFQDQIDVDAVCKTAILNLVSHRRLANEERQCEEPLSSFRVWDLHLLEKQSGIRVSGNNLTYRPRAPGLIAIEKAYSLVYDDFTTQRLHPHFFEQYPFLACDNSLTKFHVQDIPLVAVEDNGYPKPLTLNALERLKTLIGKKIGVTVTL